MNAITIRQAHAVLRDMAFFNMAESYAERDPALMAKWRKPATIIKRDDPDLKRLQRYFGLSEANIDLLFKKAAEKPGGPPSGGFVISGDTEMEEDSGGNPKWLSLAKSLTGLKEVPGVGARNSNPRIDSFFREAGFPGLYDDTSWCAAFVSAVMKRSGYPVLRDLTARSGLKYGTKLSKPKVGCIVVFWRDSPNSWKGHIGFVTGINHQTKTLKVLGGNQSNAVTEQTFPMSRVLSYRWPVEPTVKALKAAGSTEAKQSSAVKAIGITTVALGVADQVAESPPAWVPDITLPDIDAVSAISSRLSEWMGFLNNSTGIFLILAGVAVWYVAKQWQNNRIERAKLGYPILAEDLEADGVTDA